MNRIILADNQAIFRAGAARMLSLEEDMRIVAQCEDAPKLLTAVDGLRGSLSGTFAFGVGTDLAALGVLTAILLAIGSYLFSKIQL